jgi:hypothetical protein
MVANSHVFNEYFQEEVKKLKDMGLGDSAIRVANLRVSVHVQQKQGLALEIGFQILGCPAWSLLFLIRSLALEATCCLRCVCAKS